MRFWKYGGSFLFLTVVSATAMLVLACSGSSGNATVTTSLSDPATCGPPQGAFSHIYVTVTDVQISQSATANANESGWVDLTPKLKNNPVQVDLLEVANQCFLATLGSQGKTARVVSGITVFGGARPLPVLARDPRSELGRTLRRQ